MTRKIRRRLERGGEIHPDVEAELARIDSNVDSVLRLSDSLANEITRSARRKPELHSVKELVHDALEAVSLDQGQRDRIEIEVEVAPDAGEILVDHALFTDALLNLLINAVEAMPDGGRLTVSARADNAEVKLWVEDTGSGISESHLERVFHLGFTTKAGSSGFGLWSVKRTVALYGGRIDVSSVPGRGTTITMSLPQADSPVLGPGVAARQVVPAADRIQGPAPGPEPKGTGDSRRVRILVIEDDELWRKETGEILRAEGFDVNTAATKADAKELLGSRAYDLLILDLNLLEEDLEKKDGMEILRELSDFSPRPRVIVLTGYGTQAAMREAFLEHGVEDFIRKQEFDEVDLVRQIRERLPPAEPEAAPPALAPPPPDGTGHRQPSEPPAAMPAHATPPPAITGDPEPHPRPTEVHRLALHWGRRSRDLAQAVAGLQIGGVLVRDDAELQERAAGELERLLGVLFKDARSLHLGSPKTGKSHTSILVVRPEYLLPAQTVIFKYGDRSRIKLEYRNYRNFSIYLEGGRCSHIWNHDQLDLLGGIIYSMLGAGDDLQSFEDFYRHAPAGGVTSVLTKLLTGTCGRLYSNPEGPSKTLDLRDEYLRYLAKLRLKPTRSSWWSESLQA